MASPRTQRGFSLVAAIFLIVAALLIVLAAAATLNSRSRSSVAALEASRAYFAARGGLEIAIARALAGGCAAVPASLTLEGYDLDLQCVDAAVDEGGAYTVYQLTARARRGSFVSGTFVSRQVRATVRQ
jgi:MSHA biogenesis protein MshP